MKNLVVLGNHIVGGPIGAIKIVCMMVSRAIGR